MFFVGGRWIMEILTFARPTLRPPVVYCRCAAPPRQDEYYATR
ncbi:hypothetical protein [Escherichia phage vB_EcoM_DE16]|nr:hypothetical protein [Escherichia phage vB_EcoM_DE16]